MKQIDITIPKDVLRSLFEGKQTNVPFTVTEEGQPPLRVVIWATAPQPPVKKYGGQI